MIGTQINDWSMYRWLKICSFSVRQSCEYLFWKQTVRSLCWCRHTVYLLWCVRCTHSNILYDFNLLPRLTLSNYCSLFLSSLLRNISDAYSPSSPFFKHNRKAERFPFDSWAVARARTVWYVGLREVRQTCVISRSHALPFSFSIDAAAGDALAVQYATDGCCCCFCFLLSSLCLNVWLCALPCKRQEFRQQTIAHNNCSENTSFGCTTHRRRKQTHWAHPLILWQFELFENISFQFIQSSIFCMSIHSSTAKLFWNFEYNSIESCVFLHKVFPFVNLCALVQKKEIFFPKLFAFCSIFHFLSR